MSKDALPEKIERSLIAVSTYSPDYLPLTTTNFNQISEHIEYNITHHNDDAPYYYYLNELIKLIKSGKDNGLSSMWIAFLQKKTARFLNMPKFYYEEYINSHWLYTIVAQLKTYDHLIMWQLECGTFEDETINVMLNAKQDAILEYLSINKYNAKLIRRAIDLGITQDNYVSFYDFILFGGDYEDAEITKCMDEIRVFIIESNSVDNFIEYAHDMGEFNWNTELLFKGLNIPDDYKLGVII